MINIHQNKGKSYGCVFQSFSITWFHQESCRLHATDQSHLLPVLTWKKRKVGVFIFKNISWRKQTFQPSKSYPLLSMSRSLETLNSNEGSSLSSGHSFVIYFLLIIIYGLLLAQCVFQNFDIILIFKCLPTRKICSLGFSTLDLDLWKSLTRDFLLLLGGNPAKSGSQICKDVCCWEGSLLWLFYWGT